MRFVDELRRTSKENDDFEVRKLVMPEKELKKKLIEAAKQGQTEASQNIDRDATDDDVRKAVKIYRKYPSLNGVKVSWRRSDFNYWLVIDFKW